VRWILATLALALTACPLPQPLPAVGRNDGTTVPPPMVVVDSAEPAASLVVTRADCPPVSFSASIEDADLEDPVEARWFVDYAPSNPEYALLDAPPAAEDGIDPLRPLAPFHFEPSAYAGSGGRHVVEVVVSNGFHSPATPGLALPNRTPRPGYQTQVFRWFVVLDPAAQCP
jgi:hypothetical protein